LVVYLLAATGPDGARRLDAERRDAGHAPGADIGVAGDAPAVAEAVRRWADAGADTVVLQPTADDPDPEGFVRFAATEVAPLLR
jgi:alkanesulfonate monooxygenase SsuD/methylene tetrahydromethanopterin reductase-like flavin-dependent oxidoreductase (luciferase family)